MADGECLYISISGLIGAGKSTLATALGEELGLPVYYEPVKDNVYLEDFYKAPERHSFALQVYLLNKRFKQQQQIVWQGKGAVQDRTIYEDRVFATMLVRSGLMEQRDFETYLELFSNMSNFMKRPNVIVHLEVSPKESMRRIQLRSRDCETTISMEYLEALHAAYEDFLQHISKVIPVIRVDYSQFRSTEDMAAMVRREYAMIANIRVAGWDTVEGH